MDIRNYGTLNVCHTKKVTDEQALAKAQEVLNRITDCDEYTARFDLKTMTVEINDLCNQWLETDLIQAQHELKPDVWFDGDLDYYGDYDGWIDVRKDKVESGDKSSEDLHYATDDTLIGILRKRGYTVTKKTRKGQNRGGK